MAPPTNTATGMISTAWSRERASEMAPTSDGDGTSPSTWMAKMLRATAVARMCGETRLTMAELIGPVDANRHSSAATIAVQYTAGGVAARARGVGGAPARGTRPRAPRGARLHTAPGE